MTKRSWTETDTSASAQPSARSSPAQAQHSPTQRDQRDHQPDRRGTTNGAHGNSNPRDATGDPTPQLSRKIKACDACRRHKIKCIVDDVGQPCRRCAKHKVECVLDKNLQAIIDEKVQYTRAIFRDLENLHANVTDLMRNAGLRDPGVLHTKALRNPRDAALGTQQEDNITEDYNELSSATQQDDRGLSRDISPELSPDDEPNLSQVPIHSMYALTKLRALRSPDSSPGSHPSTSPDDFIARGAFPLEDAERLFLMYRDRLDAFMFGVGCPYRTLDELRSRSAVLTAAILTVAALHDPLADPIYTICSSEFRQLIERSIFCRSINRDYLRALCVASYWLSDMSWMLSGYAIRRAFEYELHSQLQRAIREGNSEEATDGTRLWFILHISDQRLATLYGRPAIVHECPSIYEINSYLDTPLSNAQDKRLMSQVALLSIFKTVRELFGPDTGKPIPRAYLPQVTQLGKELDHWFSHWSGIIEEEYDHIGRFPRKAARLHLNFAKLLLYSHVFRGFSGNDSIPHYLVGNTSAAIEAAASTIDLILTDPDAAAVVVGMPSYLHCMTAFACMFLIRVAHKYGEDLVDPEKVFDMTTRLVLHFRSVPAGKWHLTQLMTRRLERMASILRPGGIGPCGSQPFASGQHVAMDGGAGGAHPHEQVLATGPLGVGSEMFTFEYPTSDFLDCNMNFGLPALLSFDSAARSLDAAPF